MPRDERNPMQASPALLTAILGAGVWPTGRQHVAQDLTGIEWRGLLAYARGQKVESLLFAALKELSLLGRIPPAVHVAVEQAYWHTRVTNLLMADELAARLAVFAQAGIPVVVLKGAALAFTLYPDPALRCLGDIDLLVHAEQRTLAMAVLEDQGFAPYGEMQEGFCARYSNERAFRRCGKPPVQVDLHWALSGRSYWRQRTSMTWFWAHTAPWSVGGQPALMLGPEAQLLHLCAHAWQHGTPKIRWSYDIALLLTRWSIDWDEVLAIAPIFGFTAALQATLASVGDLWGVQLPSAGAAHLAALPVPWGERVLQEFIAVDHGRGLVLLDGLGQADPRSTLAFWWKVALPSPEFMRRRYGLEGHAALAARYLQRAMIGVLRAGRAAVRAVWRSLDTSGVMAGRHPGG